MTLENLLVIHKLQRFEASAAGVNRRLAAAELQPNCSQKETDLRHR